MINSAPINTDLYLQPKVLSPIWIQWFDSVNKTVGPIDNLAVIVPNSGSRAFTKATIDKALIAIGTTNKITIILQPGTWVIGANTDWSVYTNVTFRLLPGVVLSHSSNNKI
jgi:hypothetical protein